VRALQEVLIDDIRVEFVAGVAYIFCCRILVGLHREVVEVLPLGSRLVLLTGLTTVFRLAKAVDDPTVELSLLFIQDWLC